VPANFPKARLWEIGIPVWSPMLIAGVIGNWFFGRDYHKGEEENYPVAIPPRNPKATKMRIRAALGFPSLLVAGLKRHRRTAAKALLAKPLSGPLMTSICSALPRSVTVACRNTTPSKWCRRSLRAREGYGHLRQVGLSRTLPRSWAGPRNDCA
jgi:hypothetical protein